MLVEPDQPGPAFLARRLRALFAWPELVLDEVDGVLAFVCGATRAQQLLEAFGDFARRELGGAYRGVLSRPVHSAAVMPGLYAYLRRALPVAGGVGPQEIGSAPMWARVC